tara:strand:- start:6865 stop:7377 length:513 start_codon:yes stop_codon:yes gene_type:complete
MSESISRKIKTRNKANDIFLTPMKLARKHIDLIEYEDSDIWYDPFKNTGNYYNQYPNDNKVWSEILDGKDFFEYDEEVDIICSNPPYSMIDKVLKKSIELNPHTISYLIGQNNLTAKRIEDMNKSGYGLYKVCMLKVWDWYGLSYIVYFKKGAKNCIDIDRTIYYTEKED